ncbi:TolB family protein [Rhabdothermincola sediminis]|uniref:TolB family protein n=1 Tax=Rhabdothermincola sediminis TaxID=2751370 RepID=UPI001AA08F71|nr:PD40 domain-containing protein [Rhabdothermincola sediminis]
MTTRAARCSAPLILLALLAAALPAVIARPVRALNPGATTLRGSANTSGTIVSGWAGQLSGDGQYLAFSSTSPSVLAGVPGVPTQVYLRGPGLGSAATPIVHVSRGLGGLPGNAASIPVSISADGGVVLFRSYATNLVAGDTNLRWDLFVFTRATGTVERVSVGANGEQADGNSLVGSLSADGRFVAFASDATNLWPGGTTRKQVYVLDRQTGSLDRISAAPSGVPGDGPSDNPSISADGRLVAFESTANNLGGDSPFNTSGIYVRDRLLGSTTLVSVNTAGVSANGDAQNAAISGDGRFVVFDSDSTNLDPRDVGVNNDVFVRDRQLGRTELVSVTTDDTVPGGDSYLPAISANGRFITYTSDADDIVPDDNNESLDVFVRDRVFASTERASLLANGGETDGDSEDPFYDDGPRISADGRYIAFESYSSKLRGGTTGDDTATYIRDLGLAPEGASRFTSLDPVRILDSRAGSKVGPYSSPWGAGTTRDVQVTGVGGVPSTATAVVLNVTVTETSDSSFLSVWPKGQARPTVSSLNWQAGWTVPNAVTVKVGVGGMVSMFNNRGSVHVIVDVVGFYDPTGGAGFTPLDPARILDSRAGSKVGPYSSPWGAGMTRDVQVAGIGGVPGDAEAVVLNVTVTETSDSSFLSVWPKGQARPTVSSLNWQAGWTVPNAVTVKVGAGGMVSMFNNRGSVHVIVDVVGYFRRGTGWTFYPVDPGRILDSRPTSQVGPYSSPWSAGTTRDVTVTGGTAAVPSLATAVLMNVTVTETTDSSFLSVWPKGQPRPTVSSSNWRPGWTIPNAVTAKLGTGKVSVFNNRGSVQVIADVAGWYG